MTNIQRQAERPPRPRCFLQFPGFFPIRSREAYHERYPVRENPGKRPSHAAQQIKNSKAFLDLVPGIPSGDEVDRRREKTGLKATGDDANAQQLRPNLDKPSAHLDSQSVSKRMIWTYPTMTAPHVKQTPDR